MSVILAVKKENQLVIASDSQQNFGSNLAGINNIRESKIRQIGEAYFSFSGWGLYSNIFDDFLTARTVPRLTSHGEIFTFFQDFWKQLHERYSFVSDQCDDKESPFGDLDTSFLVVTTGKIFHISGNMSVSEFLKYHAIGSGSDFAIGAMHALYEEAFTAEEIAKKAVQAAIDHNVYCGGEIEIRTMKIAG